MRSIMCISAVIFAVLLFQRTNVNGWYVEPSRTTASRRKNSGDDRRSPHRPFKQNWRNEISFAPVPRRDAVIQTPSMSRSLASNDHQGNGHDDAERMIRKKQDDDSIRLAKSPKLPNVQYSRISGVLPRFLCAVLLRTRVERSEKCSVLLCPVVAVPRALPGGLEPPASIDRSLDRTSGEF